MADAIANLELLVGGKRYGGWKRISVRQDIDALAGSFELEVTDRWPGQSDRWPLKAGEACSVTIDGETVLTGYIDDLSPSLEGDARSISITGRSRTGDLVDCSAVHTPGSWSGRSLEAIAAELAKPFGIKVTAKTSTAPPIRKFALQPGEAVAEAIARLCKMRGLLAIATIAGNIEIVTPRLGSSTVRIEEGKHALRIQARHDVSDRFSRYIAKGQAAGDDHVNGKAAAGPKAEATDPAVTRYRPLIVVAEDQSDIASLKKRAIWESTVRRGRAQEAAVTLNGWRKPGGKLWEPMQAVDLVAPAALISGKLLVAGVQFELGERGQVVTLRLAPAEAFSQLAVPEKAKASSL